MLNPGTRKFRTARTTLQVLLVLLAAIIPYSSAIHGEWIYDDRPQILQNHLIQQPGLVGQALLSDVWAFKQADEVPVSNYWRPTFVGWLVLNERAFGLDSPAAWRIALLLLHATVCLLVWRLARQLRLGGPLTLGVAVLFAVHPVHVESVAWISGATDPLLGLFVLLALIATISAERATAHRGWLRIAGWSSYAFALGSKEVAVMLPLLIPFVLGCAVPETRWRQRLLIALPYLGMAVGFLVARSLVLQRFQLDLPSHLSLLELAVNVPRLLVFYVGQCLWPWPLSPNYALRAFRLADPWTWQLTFQYALATALIVVAAWQARRSLLARCGIALFALLLLPAFNLNAFQFDQIVHDRYLYVPVLGLLLVLAAIVQPLLERAASTEPGSLRQNAPWLAAAAVAITSLGAMSWSYAKVWSHELSLWQRAVQVDSESASSWAALASVQWQEKQAEAASASASRAISLAPLTAAYLLRAEMAVAHGDAAAAESDLRKVLASFPTFRPAIERLALLLQTGRRFDEAVALLQAFRKNAPQYACRTNVDLAILNYLIGDKVATQRLLQEAETFTASDRSGACLAALFHSAQLAVEQGDHETASRQIRRYLDATATLRDRSTVQLRPAAQQLAQRLAVTGG